MSGKINLEGTKLSIKGDVTFATVQSLNEQIKGKLAVVDGAIVVDFIDVARVDTSALALCLALQRSCSKNGSIHFQNVPVCLQDIAVSVGVEALFSSDHSVENSTV